MDGSRSRTTTDHDEIRLWVERNGGTPANVRYTDDGYGPGVLQIVFPGCRGQELLEPISWEIWFKRFDDAGLSFLYQAARSGDVCSTFFRLVKR